MGVADKIVASMKGVAPHHAGVLSGDVLRRMEELIGSSFGRTLETGCGMSTIFFSMTSAEHYCFTLDDREYPNSSINYVERNPFFDRGKCRFVLGPTQKTLPAYNFEGQFDAVLIDGPHGFPFPELEYFYVYPHIKKGGFLIIDDVQIPSIARLADILADDEMFELVETVVTTAVFRRTGAPAFDREGDGWWLQRYNRYRVSPKKTDVYLPKENTSDHFSSMRLDHELMDGKLKARLGLPPAHAKLALTRSDVERVLSRYFIDGDRSSELICPHVPSMGVDRNVVKYILERPELSEEDFVIFGHFKGKGLTILDVGANFGYSATSIWTAGSNAKVVSFEPIKTFTPILDELAKVVNSAEQARAKFEFHITGLSDESGELELVMPVINNFGVSGLATADKNPNVTFVAENCMTVIDKYLGNEIATSLTLYRFTSQVTTLDRWLSRQASAEGLGRIVALKIDTEGWEGHVLKGASALLKEQKPLIMGERVHVNELARQIVFDRGYIAALRKDDKLVLGDEDIGQVNGFFIHPDHFDWYRRIGILESSAR